MLIPLPSAYEAFSSLLYRISLQKEMCIASAKIVIRFHGERLLGKREDLAPTGECFSVIQ
jgi:hypothetical protein